MKARHPLISQIISLRSFTYLTVLKVVAYFFFERLNHVCSRWWLRQQWLGKNSRWPAVSPTGTERCLPFLLVAILMIHITVVASWYWSLNHWSHSWSIFCHIILVAKESWRMRLTCPFPDTAEWLLQVLFFHNSEPVNLQPGSRYSVQQERPVPGEEHKNAVSHILTVTNAAATDSGVMECFLTTDIFRRLDITVRGKMEHFINRHVFVSCYVLFL